MKIALVLLGAPPGQRDWRDRHGDRMKYRTIVADPPWSYRTTSITTNGSGVLGGKKIGDGVEYPAMSDEAITALPVAEWADDSAHLYLWATNPRLFEAPARVMAAWGFRYVTLLTWHKLGGAPGLGYYFRGATEHVLFGVRGKAPIPPSIRLSNHFAAARGRHSVKPDRFYEIVERVSPEPRLEMFARRRRFGWDVWGNEAPEFAASQAEMGLPA